MTHSPSFRLSSCLVLLLAALPVSAQVLEPPYDVDYSIHELGSIPGLPDPYGGLCFKYDDPNVLMIGGAANDADGMIYALGVTRDRSGHIVGFATEAVPFVDAPFNDGGVAFGPDATLFLSRWPVNELGQAMPGSTTTDKVISLGDYGVIPSPGGMNFVPDGFPGEGRLKIASWAGGQFYDLVLTPDGAGTYDLVSATLESTIVGGPEGFVYVPAGSPMFVDFGEMLVSEFSEGMIAVYDVGPNGQPLAETRRVFLSGLESAEGATLDPLTGDFLFSTFGIDDRLVAVRGFMPPSEICDGLDNDIDGEIDEGFQVGNECAVGLGECRVQGFTICAADGAGTICDATPGQSSGELCNALDDDCDGEIDEDFAVGDICTASGGCANNGVLICSGDGTGTICNAPRGGSTVESCNGADDDCDGEIDEDFRVAEACSVGVGQCVSSGEMACAADGSTSICDAIPGEPSAEDCRNGLDDDCDGVADDADADCETVRTCEDADGDGYGTGGGPGCSTNGTWDCDDSDPGTSPGGVDLPGTFADEDCSGSATCDPCDEWPNRGAFMRCVGQAASDLVDDGLISGRMHGQLVSDAARSGVGRQGYVPEECLIGTESRSGGTASRR